MEELATKYSFKDREEAWYRFWEEHKFFHAAVHPQRNPFTIVIPPPNVTGILHMGHALNNTIQDILIRYKRMNGSEALWMPGTDHAGIATQNVVERKLAKEGSSRRDLGREKFLEQVWNWKEQYGSTIIRQLRRLGCSCDWERTRFTMDDGYSGAVAEAFVRLHEKGLIYRGNYIINWCPRCQTALSDEEAPHKDTQGFLYYINYPLKDSRDSIMVATTRPETMLGDTAVAVNPQDERYRGLIGKTLVLPLMDREIKIVADDFVDPAFGTGAVKVTPAHDPNDYVMGKRHNLEFINILHPDGRCNENAGDYEGMDRFEAREAVIEDLKERKLLVKIDPHQHAVGHCYRCHTVIEPYYSKQWFVKMKPLSLPGIEAVKDGRITFHPDRWTKVYLNWMENIQDWCISRQIWWGHRIPAWYCLKCHPELAANKAGKTGAGESLDISLDDIALLSNIDPIVSKTRPKCPHCGSDELMAQDPQVLDTWFSSWLWPFATFGWPFNQTMDHGPRTTVKNEAARDIEQQKKELDYFYPTAVLVTAPEIIFFWVARMIMAGFEFQGNIPFKDVYIHGTVRDDTGKKMSKSLGNSIDPLEIIDEYGTDALRFSLISITAIGQDVFLAKEKFEFGRNFCNKLWNASRFILMNLAPDIAQTGNALDKEKMDLAEAWILSRFSTTLVNLNKALDGYRLNEAANIVYDFFWHQFCDWYIELAKLHIKDAATQRVLYTVLERSLRLLHPFMPFITEEIWQKLKPEGISIMTQAWPREEAQFIDPALEENMQRVIDICTEIRNLRSQNNIKPKDTVDIGIEADNPQIEESVRAYSRYITSLAKVNTLRLVKKNAAALFSACVYGTAGGCTIQMDTGSGLDVGQERERVQAQIGEIEQHIARKDALLNNKNYVQKAPAAVVEKERQSREELLRELEKLRKITNALA